MTAVVVFDLDSTLIEMETIDELARLCGKLEECSAITRRAMNGEFDFVTSLKIRVNLIKGLNADDAWRTLFKQCKFLDGALKLIEELKNKRHHVIIVSSGFLPMTRYVAQCLGVEEYYANELHVDSECNFTGKLSNSMIIDASFKESIVKREQESKYYVIAVGDGANDLLMLKAANMSIASPLAKPVVIEAVQYHAIHLLDILKFIYESID